MILFENCANSPQSCIEAESGGAHRIELCAGLPEGGTTPSLGMVKVALREVGIPIFPIIRPRAGDFVYSELEVKQMLSDMYAFRELGVAGFVFGALTASGMLDSEINHRLLRAAEGLPVTLHRAFDMSADLEVALEQAIDLGFTRVLTSGGQPSALLGADMIRKLRQKADGRIIVMAGCGITAENAADLVARTGVTEIHGTLQSMVTSPATHLYSDIARPSRPEIIPCDYPQTDASKVQKLINSFK